ncbi:hypothetical protein [Pleionea mediterranea]|uniref:Uncharacterized protein n=1 Tax=Pleionea mediterranea TaxID=523701 RepID=A0A316FWA2_9GAMM|nr:hypothetical protein [Pleionea mediterranea]PWK51880.1 hypothetical protein C8D97_105196 [Pleionea mediterranea]
MSLKSFLDLGGEVFDSIFDGKITNLLDLTERGQKQQGYTDESGYWTERGYQRATSDDLDLISGILDD